MIRIRKVGSDKIEGYSKVGFEGATSENIDNNNSIYLISRGIVYDRSYIK